MRELAGIHSISGTFVILQFPKACAAIGNFPRRAREGPVHRCPLMNNGVRVRTGETFPSHGNSPLLNDRDRSRCGSQIAHNYSFKSEL